MDRLQSMRVFYKVATARSFACAAKELDMSNAVVSRLVSDLEQHLQTRLLNRTTRNVSLTEAGQEYFQRCESVLEQIDEAEASCLGLQASLSGKLRMLVSFSEGIEVITPRLPEFRARYPNIVLELHLAEQTVDIVDRQFDIAIQPEIFVFSNSVVVRDLMSANMIMCASAAYAAAHPLPTTPADIEKHDCISFSSEKLRDTWVLSNGDKKSTVHPKCVLMSNNIVPLIGSIRSGLGIGLIFESLVRDELADGRLIRVLPDYHLPETRYFIVYPTRKYVPAKVRAMVNFLLEIFAEINQPNSSEFSKIYSRWWL